MGTGIFRLIRGLGYDLDESGFDSRQGEEISCEILGFQRIVVLGSPRSVLDPEDGYIPLKHR